MITILKNAMMRKIYTLLSATLMCFFAHAQTAKTGIQVSDLLKIKDIGSIIMSPTEDYVLFSVRSVVDADRKWEHDYQNQWWILRFDPEPHYRPFTSGKEIMGQPQISPDGSKILFSRGVNGRSQLFIWHMDGGVPVQLTDFKYGASSPRWSPDGKRIVFSASFSFDSYAVDSVVNPQLQLPKWSMEKPGWQDNSFIAPGKSAANPDGNLDEIRAYLRQNEKDRKAKVIHKLRFQGERSTNASYSVSHLFVMDAGGKEAPKQLTFGYNSFGSVHFKNNNNIWVSGRKDSDKNPERDSGGGQLYNINLNTGAMNEILSEDGVSTRLMAISDDGRSIAYWTSLIDTLVIGELHVVSKSTGDRQSVVLDLDRQVSGVKFDPAGENLYFTSQRNGGSVLYRYNIERDQLDQLSSEDVGINSFVVGTNRIIYAQTDIANPSELYMADANRENVQVITDFNSSWLKDRALVPAEKHSFTNELGLDVEYWVMKPLNYESGKKYPLVLQIHGGPSAMWGPGVASMWHEYQYFAAQGYGIVYSNPRGSGGYGVKFLQANYRDWGEGPARDVLKALDLAVAEGWADPDKLLITGGSYAGYLTNWIISHDHRFLAASAQRGVYHLPTFFGEGNASGLVPRYFGGYPWEPEVRKILEEQSPYNYVSQVETPLLIFHGEVDLRTGVIQSEMLYKSLKQLGKEVEYVRHPGGDHELTRSGDNRQRIDQMLRTYEFFERYVQSRD